MFTNGQKQLIFLARAIIQRSRVIYYEEASERENDQCSQIINTVLRQRFKNKTVFILSNNISSLIDVDRVMVFKDGRIVEFAHPYKLMI